MSLHRSCASRAGAAAGQRTRLSLRSPTSRPLYRRCRGGVVRATETEKAAAAAEPVVEEFSNDTRLRSEAQAPFRVFRQFLLSAFGASATIGFGVSFIQFATGLAGAPSAPPVSGSVQNLGIDGIVLALCAFFWRRDEAAKHKQMSRISRESALGGLRLLLASGRPATVAGLRSFARVVIAAGSGEHVSAAAAAAEPFKADLLARGVLFIPVVLDGTDVALPPDDEKKWRATPLSLPAWRAWVGGQKDAAGVPEGAGVYVSLRMDGRVRASGVGLPPWQLLAASLPPVDGVFGGWLDGMDGSVASE